MKKIPEPENVPVGPEPALVVVVVVVLPDLVVVVDTGVPDLGRYLIPVAGQSEADPEGVTGTKDPDL